MVLVKITNIVIDSNSSIKIYYAELKKCRCNKDAHLSTIPGSIYSCYDMAETLLTPI